MYRKKNITKENFITIKFFIALFVFLILLFNIITTSLALEFKNSIAMHGDTKRPNKISRDIHVNVNAPYSKILKLAQIGTYNSLNPYIISGIAPPGIKGLVIESLMTWSPDEPFSLYPGIAESIKSPKNRKWAEFKINSLAKFSNGDSITTEDIIFSWKILKEKGRPHTRSYYSLVEKVYSKKNKIIRFEFSNKSNYEMPLIIGLMPIFSKSYWDNRNFDKTTLTPFIGSGPYKIKKLEAGRYIIYEKDLNWWRTKSRDSLGRYNFQIIRYDFYRDVNIALEAFLSGEYDIHIENDAVRWKTNLANNNNIITKTFPRKYPSGIEAIIFNSRRHPFNDVNVRQAICLLFPYEFINKILFHNLLSRTYGAWDNSYLKATTILNRTSLNILSKYKDQISIRALEVTNINKEEDKRILLKNALKLLEKSDWNIKKNILVNKQNNKQLSFSVLTNQPRMERLLLIWAQQLEKIGIKMKVLITDSAQYQYRLQKFDFDSIVFKYNMSLSPGNEQSIYWGSWAANQNGSRNYAGINHPAIDESINMIVNSKNREQLIEATQTLDRLLRAGKWMLPLFHDPLHRIALQKNIKIPSSIPLYGLNPWVSWRQQ